MDKALSVDTIARLRSAIGSANNGHLASILGAVAGLMGNGKTVTGNAVTAALGVESDAAKAWMGTGSDEEGNTALTALPRTALPTEIDPAARHGVLGEFVEAVLPCTEASEAALLFTAIVAFGVLVGGKARMMIGADVHPGSTNGILVGQTSRGRKGTSLGYVLNVAGRSDESFITRMLTGLSSGEGVVHAVRDPHGDDEGVEDKRLLIEEPEFASVLAATRREGNRLSPIIRNAWDRRRLGNLTKNPVTATDHHIGIIAHITEGELRTELRSVDISNGFANRFLFVCVNRSKLLPFPKQVDTDQLNSIVTALAAIRIWANEEERVLTWAPASRDIWEAVYTGQHGATLTRERPGPLGGVTSRAEAHTIRIATLYATLDRSPVVEARHLLAALAVIDYADESAAYLFGSESGSDEERKLLAALEASEPHGLTRNEIREDVFHRNKSATFLDGLLQDVVRSGRISESREFCDGPGRPTTRYAVRGNAVNAVIAGGNLSAAKLRVSELAPDKNRVEADLARELVG